MTTYFLMIFRDLNEMSPIYTCMWPMTSDGPFVTIFSHILIYVWLFDSDLGHQRFLCSGREKNQMTAKSSVICRKSDVC